MGRKCAVLLVPLCMLAAALPAEAQFFTNVERLNPDGNSGDTEPAVSEEPLGESTPTFVDRDHVYVTVPEALLGAEYIQTANDDKDNPNHELHFTVTADGTLYLFLDNRIGGNSSNTRDQLPNLGAAASLAWVTDMGFVDTGMKIAIDEATDGDIDQWFSVYSLRASSGAYVLGAQNDGGSRNMYGVAFGAPRLKASKPDPADGATGVALPLFNWTKGDTAALHNLYLGTSPELTEADLVMSQMPTTVYYHGPGLVPGTTYYWRVDEIEIDMVTVHTGDVWSFTAESLTATAPTPADEAEGVFPSPTLSWMPGTGAYKHQVYFSSNFADVSDGTAAADQGQMTETEFSPGLLRSSTTYYWRVDEVKVDGSVEPGAVWSFTTADAFAKKIVRQWWSGIGGTGVANLTGNAAYPHNPTGSELLDTFEGPVDWADNYGSRLYGWLIPPQSGEYTFWIASDDSSSLRLSTDADPANASQIANVSGYTDPREWTKYPDTQESEPIALQAGQKYYIEAVMKEGTGGDNIAVSWQGGSITAQEIISAEYVDAYALPSLQAFGPSPADRAVDTASDGILSWEAGASAQQHEIYFGDDEAAVAAADPASPLFQGRQTGTTLNVGPLEWGKTFYWRVDEINDGDPESPWVGRVWSFTTIDYIVVDDFESYTDNMDAGEALWQAWIDGLTNQTGSIVGYFDAINGTFGETTIVHGGRQSMPFDFNNVIAPYYSEAELEFSPAQDWTINGVTDLSIWFRGRAVDFVETGANAFTMSAAGADIAGTTDEFTYAYQTLSGNGTIVAKVESVENTNGWAKAAVMIRQTLEPNAKFAMICATPGQGVRFQARLIAADGHVSDTPVATPEQIALRAPVWIKLERIGDLFNGYYSLDGNSWTAMVWNPQTIAMIGDVYIGLALTSHSSGNVCTAEFSNVAATGNVTGQRQFAQIGTDHLLNGPAGLYVALQDSNNKTGGVVHPDPMAVGIDTWTEFRIPLTLFNVNAGRIKKLLIGAGDRNNPTPGGAGLFYIDDIRVMRPAAEEPVAP